MRKKWDLHDPVIEAEVTHLGAKLILDVGASVSQCNKPNVKAVLFEPLQGREQSERPFLPTQLSVYAKVRPLFRKMSPNLSLYVGILFDLLS